MSGFFYAIFAGFCAALASVCAKLAMATEATSQLCQTVVTSDILSSVNTTEAFCDWFLLYIRIMFFSLIFVFNAIMWTSHVKSLQLCSSSVQASVVNTASNILLTALIGQQLFGETLSLMWWSGASLILVGLLLIHHGAQGNEKEKVS